MVKHQEAASGLWWQVTDQGSRKGNYLEAIASRILVYALAKGVNSGSLQPEFADAARKEYNGLIRDLVKTDAEADVIENVVGLQEVNVKRERAKKDESPKKADTAAATGPWISDQGDGTYRNPVLCADY